MGTKRIQAERMSTTERMQRPSLGLNEPEVRPESLAAGISRGFREQSCFQADLRPNTDAAELLADDTLGMTCRLF